MAVVEFIGMPGSGKSTIAQLVATGLGGELVTGQRYHAPRDAGRAVRRLMLAGQLVRSPAVSAAVLCAGGSRRIAADIGKLNRDRRRTLGHRVFDEQALHWLILYGARGMLVPQRVLPALQLPDLVVWTQPSTKIALARIRKREQVVDLDRMADDEVIGDLRAYAQMCDEIAGRLRCPWVMVDTGSLNPPQAANLVLEKLSTEH